MDLYHGEHDVDEEEDNYPLFRALLPSVMADTGTYDFSNMNIQSRLLFLELMPLLLAEEDRARGSGSVSSTPPASERAISSLEEIDVEEVRSKGEEVEPCAVCTEAYESAETVLKLPCQHVYHSECLLRWLRSHASCPTCRFEVESNDPNYEASKRNQSRQEAVDRLSMNTYN